MSPGLEAYEGEPGCSPSTHAWFVEVYAQVRQMAYDLRLEELHEVARRLEAVHRVVHPPVEVRLSVPRGPDERQRMSAFLDQVLAPGSSTHPRTHNDDDDEPALRDDDAHSTRGGRVVEGDPSHISDADVPLDNPNDETF